MGRNSFEWFIGVKVDKNKRYPTPQIFFSYCTLGNISDATKLRSILEPARLRVLEAVRKTESNRDEAGLLQRIDAAVEKTVKYFVEIKAMVS